MKTKVFAISVITTAFFINMIGQDIPGYNIYSEGILYTLKHKEDIGESKTRSFFDLSSSGENYLIAEPRAVKVLRSAIGGKKAVSGIQNIDSIRKFHILEIRNNQDTIEAIFCIPAQ